MTVRRARQKVCLSFAPAILLPALVFSLLAQTGGSGRDAISLALRNGEFVRALELLAPALQSSPEDASLWTMQGKAFAGEAHTQAALASFHKALRIDPDYVPALQGEAQIEFEAGRVSAIPVLKHLLRLHPADRTSHGMMAVLQYREGNCGDAVVHFEKAAGLFDSQVDALHAYAVCLVRLKRFDQAAKVFDRSLALAPGNERERQLLASLQLMSGKPKEALATLAPLLGSGAPDVATLELASAAYEDDHKTDRAVDLLQRAISLDPSNVNLYLDFANLSCVHQSFQVGIDVVNDGINLQPTAAPLYFARGVLLVQVGKYDQAQSDLEKAYALDPNQSLSVAAQGLAAVNANDLDRALATVQASLIKKPNDPILLYLQADVLIQQGAGPGTPNFELAMRSAKKAVSLRPTLGPARGVLAKLYLQLGQYQDALEQCRKALEIDPTDQTALYRLIQASRKAGHSAEIPGLLKRLAVLRQESAKKEVEQYRYKLVEDSTASE
jgi:tetratricopeptide (TPR) repeat protein